MTFSPGLLLSVVILITACRKSLSASLYGLEYNPDDFVVAQPSCVHRLPLREASREWRGKGIRAYTVINDTSLADQLNRETTSHEHLETYGYWEDDSLERDSWRGGNVGDTRAAVTPFMAHRHFGDTYKWMLYGDDDTLLYMTGVLKLLSQFDPEQPLAITDNIWYLALHPSPSAPRCLPCGFNTSTIKTQNHTFTPRPACPFCTRALACGTYSARYRCNETHMRTLDEQFGPSLATAAAAGGTAAAAGGGGGGADGKLSPSGAAAMRETAARYAAWMDRHVELKSRYPYAFRNKPTMDWEMRDPPAEQQPGAGSGLEGEADVSSDARRRRLQQQRREGRGRRGERRRGRSVLEEDGHDGCGGGDMGDVGDVEGGRRRWLARRPRPTVQAFVNGTPWLSAALGRELGGPEDPEREALQLPYPFCARHDERRHTLPAPSCLISISGHGGTGIILSVGLMRMIDPQEAIRFITQQRGCGGGDCLLGRLLWFRMGIGFTDPGTALQNGAERYEKFARFIDSNHQMPQILTLADPTEVLLRRRKGSPRAPSCDRSCVWLIENVVGAHVRAQGHEANSTAQEMLKRLHAHRRAYEWVLAARRDPEVQAGRVTVVKWVKARYHNSTQLAPLK